jgi:hypothetical protein
MYTITFYCIAMCLFRTLRAFGCHHKSLPEDTPDRVAMAIPYLSSGATHPSPRPML